MMYHYYTMNAIRKPKPKLRTMTVEEMRLALIERNRVMPAIHKIWKRPKG